MLNKRVDKPKAVQVPLAAYSGDLGSRCARRVPEPSDDRNDGGPEASFVLFYADLKAAAAMRGLALKGTACDVWAAVMRNVTVEEEDPDDSEDNLPYEVYIR